MKGFAVVLTLAALSQLVGCGSSCAARYVPGQLFGDSGRTACVAANGSPIRCSVDGGVPWCPPPDDGDEWDTRNQVAGVLR